jgi:nucleotide-binding universal stress UspA family protein
MIRKLLVPTDFSPPSEAALGYAVGLARDLGATITILHVYQLPNYVFPDGTVLLARAETTAQIAERTDAALERSRRSVGEAVAVATQTAEGPPAEEIVRAAEAGGYDLIVMGTHGRTGLPHLLLGSVAERVVRTATRPVLTIRCGGGKP